MATPKPKIRWAVVGAGNIAQVAVLPAFQHATESSELVAIVSSDEEKREELGRKYGVRVGSYDELESILQSEKVDAAYITVPNTLHREYTERAARVGVHVLCEKPMATTEEDCEAMIRACERTKVKLMIAYRLHFEEANLRAVELVKSGKLGEPRIFSSVFTQQARPGDIRTRDEVGGGALYDTGIYCINAARYLFRAEPTEVFAFQVKGNDERFQGVDESTTAIMRFPDGKLAQVSTSQAASKVSECRVVGTKGDLVLEPAFGYTTDLKHRLTIDGETTEQSFPKRDQFAPELLYFARCIQEGTEPEPSGREGLADIRVIRACIRSAETGQPVKLGPFAPLKYPDISQNIFKPPVEEEDTVNAPSPAIH
jgi:predicted dehydrogenase